MKPSPFRLHRPEHLDDALQLLAEHGDGAKVLAGGQSLVPMLALRLAQFDELVDINGISELGHVARRGEFLEVGAMTRHRTIEHDDLVMAHVPLLAHATREIGHVQIRNRGTLGGALAHADPAAEHPAVAVALDATFVVASPRGRRQIAACDFFEGVWSTALSSDELLVAARFPVWSGRTGVAVEEIARRHGDFAIVGVACAVRLVGGAVERAAIALFGVGPTPVRARESEAALVAGASLVDVAAAAAHGLDPVDDLQATGDYRRRVVPVTVRRAVERAIEDAGHE